MIWQRYIYFAILNLLFVVIFINIFAGIIIDKFSAMRIQLFKKEKDIATVCFICGQTKYVFYQLTKKQRAV